MKSSQVVGKESQSAGHQMEQSAPPPSRVAPLKAAPRDGRRRASGATRLNLRQRGGHSNGAINSKHSLPRSQQLGRLANCNLLFSRHFYLLCGRNKLVHNCEPHTETRADQQASLPPLSILAANQPQTPIGWPLNLPAQTRQTVAAKWKKKSSNEMQAKNTNKVRQFSSLLNEHWKRKQRLKRSSTRCQQTELSQPGKCKSLHLLGASEVLGQRDQIVSGSKEEEEKTRGDVAARKVASLARKLAAFESIQIRAPEAIRSSPRGTSGWRGSQSGGGLASLGRLTQLLLPLLLLVAQFAPDARVDGQTLMIQSDPRPTIYSGQVSFGLLLSAHSSLGAELSTSASHQVNSMLALEEQAARPTSTLAPAGASLTRSTRAAAALDSLSAPVEPPGGGQPSPGNQLEGAESLEGEESRLEADSSGGWSSGRRAREKSKRQIFERAHGQYRRQQQQQAQTNKLSGSRTQLAPIESGMCSQVNPNALYAGMGAIWASHQANLVGDSHLAIGTYVYDSCNDLDVGQRQSVRIVSNLNAFQQTTCESPRGSPISLTIAHGDNQLRAIQLLTSFRVPVITTKEHFALEDYNQLTREQKRFLFTTAPSSRHLAVGALRFTKRIVSRFASSPKLPNQFYKMSSKNGLIVISRNLPARFIAYLTEMIPNHVNYEMLQSNQPIDQIRSVAALESILIKSQGGSLSSGESRLVGKRVKHDSRQRRNLDDSDPSGDSASDDQSGAETDDSKMLSPTILMFITPSEAIDLVTRLRNDLAEVSKYYSLIVTTREDISPALKTIFHRGGARLCSGKAFYTISPKPDEISEFSRYFRDTVQMEGETSDHPLICEFSKFQSSSKISADLDDISAEPVIKAVWSAAAAFKSVHRRECASLTGAAQTSNVYRGGGSGSSADGARTGGHSETEQPGGGEQAGRVISGRQSNKSAHAECLVKMNKNMSNLVQRALKRLDVTINSTGLQALDGFRIKFDDMNELMTNKFSIKYINKECEITELGQYSGFKDSSLRLDEETLVKSLESTMPDPWPVTVTPSPPEPGAPATKAAATVAETSQTSNESSKDSPTSADGPDSSAGETGDSPPASSGGRGRRKPKAEPASDESGGEEESGNDGDKTSEPPKRTSKRSKPSESSDRLSKRRLGPRKGQLAAAPLTAMGGRDILPGLTDTDVGATTDRTASVSGENESQPTTSQSMLTDVTQRPSARKSKAQSTSTGSPSDSGSQAKASERQTTKMPNFLATNPTRHHDDEQVDSDGGRSVDLRTRGTTQAPVYTTLPESGGNADLELPSKPIDRAVKQTTPSGGSSTKALETAAATDTTDFVTSPSVSKSQYNQAKLSTHLYPMTSGYSYNKRTLDADQPTNQSEDLQPTTNRQGSADHMEATGANNLRDLNSSPVPLIPTARPENIRLGENPLSASKHISSAESKSNRSKLRSHLKWINSSWFALTILGANICGALLTLYVLTFLLMKNCDGSLDRDNQGIRSMHLLAIIVVFFGSTLFIVYPTPGLCLLRTSWHNFALVMLFSSLLLQAMHTRSLRSLGLGGRPNRLNQFLTLLFMVGVQVAFELQRWKYESANYLSFVNQYFGSSESDEKRLLVLSASVVNQFSPLNPFNDQVTPVSIQVSEQYQNLLQDYCVQQADDFLQSQIYLCILVCLLVVFSVSTKNGRSSANVCHKLTSAMASGKMVASQHEANMNLTPSQFQFKTSSTGSSLDTGNIFLVTLVSAPIYAISIVLHIYGQNVANRDLISSVTMVSVAFAALFGIFLPILMQIHRYDGLMGGRLRGSRGGRSIMQSTNLRDNLQAPSSSAFTLFPEFAPTGLRRPSSTSGESSSGAGSRRPFAETKESRRNMGAALANLGPSADSLRSMSLYNSDKSSDKSIDPALLNLKLNLNANSDLIPITDDLYELDHNHHHHLQQASSGRRLSKSEKRLVMLDVDPCCPRHGVAAWPRSCGDQTTSKNGKSRASHSHQ